MLPQTWLQVLVLLAAVVPGFVYSVSRRGLAGPAPEEKDFSVRVLRAVIASAVFASVYALALGPVVVRPLRDDTWLVEHVRSAAGGVLLLAVLVPWVTARVVHLVATSHTWERSAQWLADVAHLHTTYNPTPSAWDFAFGTREPCWVRVLTAEGQWVGGYFGHRSFASGWPEPRDLFIEVGHAMSVEGMIQEAVSAPDGVFVRCDDARLVDFIPAGR